MEFMKLDPTNQLREWLGDEKYTKGSKLPSERALAEELGITRPLLRKALSKLEAENLIWRHIGKGTFVGTRPVEDQDFSNGVAEVTSPSEVMEVRLMLEPRKASIAALKSTQQEHQNLDHCIKKSIYAADISDFEKWDGALHYSIAASTKNELLISIFRLINSARDEKVWGQLKAASLTSVRRQNYIRQHTEIVEAIKERNSNKAQEAMYIHLITVQKNMFGVENHNRITNL